MSNVVAGTDARRGEQVVEETSLVLRTERPAGALVVEVRGALDMASTPRLRELLRTRLTSTARRVVLDLSCVSFLDTAGVVALTEAAHRARLAGMDLVLVTGNDVVDRVLGLLDLASWFRYAETVSAAVGEGTAPSEPRVPAQMSQSARCTGRERSNLSRVPRPRGEQPGRGSAVDSATDSSRT